MPDSGQAIDRGRLQQPEPYLVKNNLISISYLPYLDVSSKWGKRDPNSGSNIKMIASLVNGKSESTLFQVLIRSSSVEMDFNY